MAVNTKNIFIMLLMDLLLIMLIIYKPYVISSKPAVEVNKNYIPVIQKKSPLTSLVSNYINLDDSVVIRKNRLK